MPVIFIFNMGEIKDCVLLEIMQYKERLDEGREDDHCRCKILEQLISYEMQGNKRVVGLRLGHQIYSILKRGKAMNARIKIHR